jgi:transposase
MTEDQIVRGVAVAGFWALYPLWNWLFQKLLSRLGKAGRYCRAACANSWSRLTHKLR